MPYNTKEKQKEYAAAYRAAKMVKLLEYLSQHHCVDCGESDAIVLEFDHLPEFPKSFEIGRAVTSSTMSWKKVLLEIEKCEVVCCNCHRRRSLKRQGSYRCVSS